MHDDSLVMKTLIIGTLILATAALKCFADPPPELVAKLTAAIHEHCPNAQIVVTNGLFTAKSGTMMFTLHTRQMTGEILTNTFQEEGPNYKGFVLNVEVEKGPYMGQAFGAQELRGPYYPTFIDAPPTEDGTNHYWITFSYGGGLDPKLKQAIFHALSITTFQSGEPIIQTKQPTLRSGDVPIGSLGFSVGRYLTVEGVRVDGIKTGVQTLHVDTVNGVKLSEPVAIWVDNIDLLPENKRCVLKGYETLRMVGSPPAYFYAAKEAGQTAPGRPQAGWQISLYFVATSVISPSDLKVEKGN
jgi:hypothetical protein